MTPLEASKIPIEDDRSVFEEAFGQTRRSMYLRHRINPDSKEVEYQWQYENGEPVSEIYSDLGKASQHFGESGLVKRVATLDWGSIV